MEMLQLNDLLPPEQWEDDWTIFGEDYEGLKNGVQYVIFEHYCINPDCDCKTLTADIREIGLNGRAQKKSAALIKYDWSSAKTACTPTMHEKSPKTKLANALLAAYTHFIHQPPYIARITGQYAKIKERVLKNRPRQILNPQKNLGRNDPCHCGSGKKYKKCCINK